MQFITQDNAGINFPFCPQDVTSSLKDEIFTIVNNCNGEYQASLRYKFEPKLNKFQFVNYVSYPTKLTSVQNCISESGIFVKSIDELIYIENNDSLA